MEFDKIVAIPANAEFMEKLRQAKAAKREHRYTKLPDVWRQVLAERGASAADYAIAWEVLALARFANPVVLGNEKVAELGFGPQARRKALKRFAEWSLVWLETRPGATPLIHVKWLAGRQPGGHGG